MEILYWILAILGSIALIILLSDLLFRRTIQKELIRIKQQGISYPIQELKMEKLTHLPPPIQRYLNFALPKGGSVINYLETKLKGQFRLDQDKPWLPTTVKEVLLTDPPTRIWIQSSRMLKLFWFKGRDKYIDGEANMWIKFLSLIPIVNERARELNVASLVTFLMEIVFFPTILLTQSNITWDAIDANSAKATIKYQGESVSAVFYINQKGEITHSTSEDRFRSVKDGYSKDKYTAVYRDYTNFNNLCVPSEIEAVWNLPSGDFCYGKFKIEEFRYNDPE